MIPMVQNYEDETMEWYSRVIAQTKDVCEKCDGRGWLGEDIDPFADNFDELQAAYKSVECSCLTLANRLLAYRRGNLPRAFHDEPKFKLQFAEQLSGRLESNIFITGSNGTGKTSHATYALRRAQEQEHQFFRIEASEMEQAKALV